MASRPWNEAPGVARRRDVDRPGVDARLPRRRERVADGGHLGIGEDHPRRYGRSRSGRRDIAAEHVGGGGARLVLAHVGEQGAPVDVADRVEPLAPADPHPVVDLERPVRLDPDRLEADLRRRAACVPTATSRCSPSSFVAALELDPHGPAVAAASSAPPSRPAARRRRARGAPRSPARRRTPPRARSAARWPRQIAPAPQRGPRLRHLDADDAAAEDDEALGDGARRRDLAVRPRGDVLEPVDRRHRGCRAGRHDHRAPRASASRRRRCTRRSPSIRPAPRNSAMPRSSSHGSWAESS